MLGSNVGDDGLDRPSSVTSAMMKGKKRERENESLETVKRVAKSTGIFKPDIDKIIEVGELADSEAVDKVVKLMHTDKNEKKMDLICRSKIVGAVASTSKSELLSQFVELRGISILDEWLLEVHKGKTGEGNSPKEGDKCLEDFLLILLKALDKLPVNLTELKMSNIGKSVNMLRSHKNMDIKKKARRLIDLWKKRVEAELVHSSATAGHTENATASIKSPAPSSSQCGNKSPCENSSINRSYVVGSSVKKELENRNLVSTIPKYASDCMMLSKTAMIQKDNRQRIPVSGGASGPSFSAYGDDKSCYSSLSRTTQSCSSDQINNESSPEKEDSPSSSTGSLTNKLVLNDGFHEKKLLSGMLSPFPGIHKETRSKRITLRRYKPTKRVLHSEISNEKENKMPISDGSSHKLIIKLPNRICGPVKSITGCPPDKPSLMSCKPDHFDCISKRRGEVQRQLVDSEETIESWQSNDSTDVLHVSEGVEGSGATAEKENLKNMGGGMNVSELSKDVSSPSLVSERRVPIHEGSAKSFHVVVEGRAREPKISKIVTPGFEGGMSLLADVATEDMFECDLSGHAKQPVPTHSSGSIHLSANVDNSVRAPLVYTEQIDEDFEKQVEAGATLATLKNKASISFDESICRNLDSSMMQVERAASLANDVTENPGNFLVNSSFEAATDEIVVRQNKDKIAKDETVDKMNKSVSKLSLFGGENTLVNIMDNITCELSSKPVIESDITGNMVVDTARSGDITYSVVVSNATKECEGSISPLKDSAKFIRTAKSAEIQPGKSYKAKREISYQVDSINQRAEQLQEEMDECHVNLKTANSVLSLSVDNDSEFVMQMENQDASQDHDKVKHLDDSTCLLDSRNEAKEYTSTNMDITSATSGMNSLSKFGFDLNETCDEGENILGSPSETLPLSTVTMATAMKGPFNPPGEPRKAITNQSSSIGGSVADVPTTKETQRVLDIDLNEAYLGSLDDAQSGSFLHPYSIMSDKSADSSGFDLNLANQDSDKNQISPGKDYNPVFPFFLSKISGNNPAAPFRYKRHFDLNSCLDEVTSDISPFRERNSLQSQMPLPGLIMNSQGATNVSPWFPGSAVSVQVPHFYERSILQSHPQLLLTGPQMQKMATPSMSSFFPGTIAAAHTIPLFGSDINNPVSTTAADEIQMCMSFTNGMPTVTPCGPMLASTPAPPFYWSSQHGNLPNGTGFPMPSMSLSGGTVLVDPSSGRRHFVPGQSHPSGPISTVYSSYYPKPYLVSLSDDSNSGSRHPWDLNVGPLGLETEKGVNTFPLQMNQLSSVNANSLPAFQARMYHAAGAAMGKQGP